MSYTFEVLFKFNPDKSSKAQIHFLKKRNKILLKEKLWFNLTRNNCYTTKLNKHSVKESRDRGTLSLSFRSGYGTNEVSPMYFFSSQTLRAWTWLSPVYVTKYSLFKYSMEEYIKKYPERDEPELKCRMNWLCNSSFSFCPTNRLGVGSYFFIYFFIYKPKPGREWGLRIYSRELSAASRCSSQQANRR